MPDDKNFDVRDIFSISDLVGEMFAHKEIVRMCLESILSIKIKDVVEAVADTESQGVFRVSVVDNTDAARNICVYTCAENTSEFKNRIGEACQDVFPLEQETPQIAHIFVCGFDPVGEGMAQYRLRAVWQVPCIPYQPNAHFPCEESTPVFFFNTVYKKANLHINIENVLDLLNGSEDYHAFEVWDSVLGRCVKSVFIDLERLAKMAIVSYEEEHGSADLSNQYVRQYIREYVEGFHQGEQEVRDSIRLWLETAEEGTLKEIAEQTLKQIEGEKQNGN